MIDIRCPWDGTVHHADESHVGRSIRCQKCGAILKIERQGPAPLTQSGQQSVKPVVEADWVAYSPPAAYDAKPRFGTLLLDKIKLAGLALAAAGVILVIIWPWMRPSSQPQTAQRTASPPSTTPMSEGLKPIQPVKIPKLKPIREPRLPSYPRPEAAILPPSVAHVIPLSCPEQYEATVIVTGERLEDDNGTLGASIFVVENGTSFDALVRLADTSSHRTLRLVFLTAGDSYTFEGIEPGIYSAMFLLGKGWVQECFDFQREAGYQEFQQPLRFDEEESYATRWTVTLQPVLGGTARTRKIDRERFFEGDQFVRVEP